MNNQTMVSDMNSLQNELHYFFDNLYLRKSMTDILDDLYLHIRDLFEVAHVSLIYSNSDGLWRIEQILGEMQIFQSFEDVLDSRAGLVLETGIPQQFSSNALHPPISFEPYECIFPLIHVENHVYGCITFGSFLPFSEETLNLQDIFARRLSRLIPYISRSEQVSQHNRHLNNQVKRMRLQLQELEAYNYTVSHDLKSPLSMISLKSNLLNMTETLAPKSIQHLKDIHERVMAMSEMIDQLQTLTRIRNQTDTFMMVNTQRQIEVIIDELAQTQPSDMQITIAPDLPSVLGHIQWIDDLFTNLFTFLLKQNIVEGITPHIHIHTEKQPIGSRFIINAHGINISVDTVQQTLRQFTNGDYTRTRGFSLGLAIVHRVITQLGRDLAVYHDDEGGISFAFTLFSQ